MTFTFPRTLADYPFVVVRLDCDLCPGRRGRYRLAHLVARYGPGADLDIVRRDLAKPDFVIFTNVDVSDAKRDVKEAAAGFVARASRPAESTTLRSSATAKATSLA